MQGQHSHDVAYYRCRYPSDYALANRVDHPKNVIMREDLVTAPVDRWLASVFSPSRRQQTIEALTRQISAPMRPAIPRQRAVGDITAEFDTKIARYKHALDEGASPTVVAAWIAEAEQQRDAAHSRRTVPPRQALTPSLAATPAMTSAAIGSAQLQPKAQFSLQVDEQDHEDCAPLRSVDLLCYGFRSADERPLVSDVNAGDSRGRRRRYRSDAR
jgi:hypothetical protein